MSKTIDLEFARIQFTIDLLPSDILGSEVLDQKTNDFRIHKGPVFTNLLLADEINRAAPKVQGALLEAMQERKVTIGNENFRLPAPFLVIATQNPVEQAGTFELPGGPVGPVHVAAPTRISRLLTRRKRFCDATLLLESALKAREPWRKPNLTSWKTNRLDLLPS